MVKIVRAAPRTIVPYKPWSVWVHLAIFGTGITAFSTYWIWFQNRFVPVEKRSDLRILAYVKKSLGLDESEQPKDK